MATDGSFFKRYEAYEKHTNYKEEFTAMLSNIKSTDVNLGSVRSCLTIGPGAGEYEIEFMKQCTANISEFLAVEPDHESAEHLRTSLTTGLPGVESQVFETKLQNWEGLGDPVDLILMFHVIYYFTADERQDLFKEMHDRWLTSGGYVAIVSESHADSPGNENVLCQRLGKPVIPWEDIEADLQKAGFRKLYAYEMLVKIGLTNPDESSLRHYQRCGIGSLRVTLDYIRDALKELYPDEKTHSFIMMAIFKRTN